MRLFYTKRKQRFLVTQWPLAKWSHWPEKLDASMARSACRALSSLFSLKKRKKRNRNKVKLLCTVLHNNYEVSCCYIMITHLKMCWIAIMPLFELKKKNEEESLKFIKENKTSGNQQRATLLLLFMCLPFQIFQHAAIKHQVPVSYKIT